MDSLKKQAEEFISAGEIDKASKVYLRVLEADASDADAKAWTVLSSILFSRRDSAGAIDAAKTAISLDDTIAEAHVNLGSALRVAGDLVDAEAAFRQALQINPANGIAYYYLAAVKNHAGEQDMIDRMEAINQQDILDKQHRHHLHYALAKVYEDNGDFERAFINLEQGSQIKRELVNYSSRDNMAKTAELIAVQTSDFIARSMGDENAGENLIFVVGMPRSGTSLVEQILAAHSKVYGGGELPYLGRITRAHAKGKYPSVATNWTAQDLKSIGDTYRQKINEFGRPEIFVTDKTPHNFEFIGLIAAALPKARIVHVQRDPMDVCLSCYTNLFTAGLGFTYDQTELGEHYLDYQRLMAHWHEVLPGKIFDIQYEKLVKNQEVETRRLLEFCGLAWEENCLKFYEAKRNVYTASASQVREPVFEKSLNRADNFLPHLGALETILADGDF